MLLVDINVITEERNLVQACKRGERSAQNALFKKFGGIMLTVCKRYLGNASEAEDVLMEGFLKVFTSLSNFKEEGSLEGWIRRIIVNEALMQIRKRKMLWVDLDNQPTLQEPPMALEALSGEEILQLIDALPVGFRTVFNLYAIEGYSHAEIANLLNISEGTSKSQLSRARTFLQEKIKSYES